jgi:hypothetical protein
MKRKRRNHPPSFIDPDEKRHLGRPVITLELDSVPCSIEVSAAVWKMQVGHCLQH